MNPEAPPQSNILQIEKMIFNGKLAIANAEQALAALDCKRQDISNDLFEMRTMMKQLKRKLLEETKSLRTKMQQQKKSRTKKRRIQEAPKEQPKEEASGDVPLSKDVPLA